MELTDLQLNRQLYKTQPQTLETLGAGNVASNLSPAPSTAIASGNSVTDVNTNAETINGAVITPGTIPAETLDVSNWGWTQTCVFTSASATQVNWGSGNFVSANGVTYVISAGNTGIMAAKTYIYLDLNVANNAYQHTTTSANAVGVGKVLVAVAQNDAVNSIAATFTLNVATQLVSDNIIANTINASKIVSGSITATQISASYVYANTLSADQITAGTLSGRVVQTASTGLRVVLTPNGDAVYANDMISFQNGSTSYGRIYPFVFPQGNGIAFETLTPETTLNLVEGTQSSFTLDTDTGATGVSGSQGVLDLYGSDVQISADTLELGAAGVNCDVTLPLGSLTVTAGQMYYDNGSVNMTAGFINLAQMTGAVADARGDFRNGSMYYRTDDNVIRVRLNGAWKTITTS